MNFTRRLNLALQFAAKAHEGQKRKGTDIPYITHPVAVAIIALKATNDEDTLIAALLHDVLEDCDGETFGASEVQDKFGEDVLEAVQGCTQHEPEEVGWKTRKLAYIKHLDEASEKSLVVVAADKIHNLFSILADHAEVGDQVFERFHAEKEETLWFYEEVTKKLELRLGSSNKLVVELSGLMSYLRSIVTGELQRYYAEIKSPETAEVIWHYYLYASSLEAAQTGSRSQFLEEHAELVPASQEIAVEVTPEP
jgi:hypothetical protein